MDKQDRAHYQVEWIYSSHTGPTLGMTNTDRLKVIGKDFIIYSNSTPDSITVILDNAAKQEIASRGLWKIAHRLHFERLPRQSDDRKQGILCRVRIYATRRRYLVLRKVKRLAHQYLPSWETII
jgi:hypothetical protein